MIKKLTYAVTVLILAVSLFPLSTHAQKNKKTEYKKSKSGYEYKVYSNSKTKLKAGEAISGKQKTYIIYPNGKDTFLATEDIEYFAVNEPTADAPFAYNAIAQVLFQAGAGDSVSIVIPADSLPNLPPFIKPGDKIRFDLAIDKITSKEELTKMMEEQDKQTIEQIKQNSINAGNRNAAQREKDSIEIANWIKTNNVQNVVRTESGLYYVIEKPGTGEKVMPFKSTYVHYTGKLLDGKVFDSSLERGPFTVQVGVTGVILGWTEGLLYFRKGDTGKLIIPSYLAYGPQSPSPDIPANSPLIFDIFIQDIK